MNGECKIRSISSGTVVRMQKNTLFLFTKEETFWLPMTRREAVAEAVGPSISSSYSTDNGSRNDTANAANIAKTAIFN